MSYQVLARKWRPRDFDTLVGQDHVVRALRHALAHRRLHHAYLFTGTRGVGKTTLSRILAKALNCTGVDGAGDITAAPCNACTACTSIDAGRFIDYIEMDAASNRGVDDMVQLLERAIYAPSQARFKVYMIDEVHMLSSHAFNAMLKTLEEPPAYVKFVLATTDPQKVPVTVLSRCLQFNLKQMTPSGIAGRLAEILDTEAIAAEPAALRLLAHAARGSMRDGLSLLDQAIAHGAGAVTLDSVRGMLGAIDTTLLIRVLSAVADGDGARVMAAADEMSTRSLSFGQALRDLAALLHRIALAQVVGSAGSSSGADSDDDAEVQRFARSLRRDDVQLYYQIALHGRNDLHLAPDEFAGFTMTLLRMLAFRPVEGADAQPGVDPAGEARIAALSGARPVRASAVVARPVPRGDAAVTAPAGVVPRPGATAPASRSSADAPTSPDERESEGAPHDRVDLDWPALVARLPLQGLPRELAVRSELLGIEGQRVRLRVPSRSLASAGSVERLQAALAPHLGQSVRVEIELGASAAAAATAAGRAELARAEQQREAEALIHADPVVRKLIDEFGASLDAASIRPDAA